MFQNPYEPEYSNRNKKKLGFMHNGLGMLEILFWKLDREKSPYTQ